MEDLKLENLWVWGGDSKKWKKCSWKNLHASGIGSGYYQDFGHLEVESDFAKNRFGFIQGRDSKREYIYTYIYIYVYIYGNKALDSSGISLAVSIWESN